MGFDLYELAHLHGSPGYLIIFEITQRTYCNEDILTMSQQVLNPVVNGLSG